MMDEAAAEILRAGQIIGRLRASVASRRTSRSATAMPRPCYGDADDGGGVAGVLDVVANSVIEGNTSPFKAFTPASEIDIFEAHGGVPTEYNAGLQKYYTTKGGGLMIDKKPPPLP